MLEQKLFKIRCYRIKDKPSYYYDYLHCVYEDGILLRTKTVYGINPKIAKMMFKGVEIQTIKEPINIK